jgi:hypothetical protein
VLAPNQAIMHQCINVSSKPICKRLLKGDQSAIYLTAIAACKNFGVISDHNSPFFATVGDLCNHFGIPINPGAAAGGVSDNADWSKSAPATPSAGGPEATFRSRMRCPR